MQPRDLYFEKILKAFFVFGSFINYRNQWTVIYFFWI